MEKTLIMNTLTPDEVEAIVIDVKHILKCVDLHETQKELRESVLRKLRIKKTNPNESYPSENTDNIIEGVLLRTISAWGPLNQLDMAVEEAAELIQAINKIKRSATVEQIRLMVALQTGLDAPKMPNFIDERAALIYQGLCGEIADMDIIVLQLKLMFNRECIELIKERKLQRLIERLDANDQELHNDITTYTTHHNG
jgi:hypothetical protein